jgi:hypothetical protein
MNLQESIRRILREESSPTKKLRDFVASNGFITARKVFGNDEKFYETIDLDGSVDDNLFVIKTILNHDVVNREICNFKITKLYNGNRIEVLIFIPQVNEDEESYSNKLKEIAVSREISDHIFELGVGTVRGHNIKVQTWKC